MTGDGTVGKALDVLDRVAAFERPVRFAELLAEMRNSGAIISEPGESELESPANSEDEEPKAALVPTISR